MPAFVCPRFSSYRSLVGLELIYGLSEVETPKLAWLSGLETLQSGDDIFYTFICDGDLSDDDNCCYFDMTGMLEVGVLGSGACWSPETLFACYLKVDCIN